VSAAARSGSEGRQAVVKAGTTRCTRMWTVTKRARRGDAWRARKRRRKAGDERTAPRLARQVKAAQARLGRSGRRRKISRSKSSSRAAIVVGAGGLDSGGGGGDGDGWGAMVDWLVSSDRGRGFGTADELKWRPSRYWGRPAMYAQSIFRCLSGSL
jgi:hypothetical protein